MMTTTTATPVRTRSRRSVGASSSLGREEGGADDIGSCWTQGCGFVLRELVEEREDAAAIGLEAAPGVVDLKREAPELVEPARDLVEVGPGLDRARIGPRLEPERFAAERAGVAGDLFERPRAPL